MLLGAGGCAAPALPGEESSESESRKTESSQSESAEPSGESREQASESPGASFTISSVIWFTLVAAAGICIPGFTKVAY